MHRLLTPAIVQNPRNIFKEMDTDASGSISLAELQEARAHLSLTVTSDELDSLLQADINVIG